MSKKPDKHRGSRTYGRGKKGGRGAGLRGGRGNAGLNKHNQLKVKIDNPRYFGRIGFKRHPSLHDNKGTINVGNIQSDLPKYLESGMAKKEGKNIVIDLTETDYGKLLGSGVIKTPVTIKVAEATQKAKDKVEAAGGKVEVSDDEFQETTDEE
ncbi:MAG: uL15 family ribosomal protein [Thermoplasmata archaeon]|nr:uL15 family ribosomal protein [Thermoplasmata archaeon]MCK5397039.1 uL15 family ribosomal protein [Thermoplasmata archaeon]